MFENKNQKLISKEKFKTRVYTNVMIFLGLLFGSLFIGMWGYHTLGNLNWVDSFMEASMILGGMGPVSKMDNDAVKIFAGIYAIFCGVAFLTGITLLVAPFWHREIHKFHLADDDGNDEDDNNNDEKKSSNRKIKK